MKTGRTAVCAFLVASAAARSAFPASFSFDAPVWNPAVAVSMPRLHGSKGEPFASPPVALSVPAGAAGGPAAAQDAYVPADLWACDTLSGRWRDASSNMLWVARFSIRLPPPGTFMTYGEWGGFRTDPRNAFDAASERDVTEAVASVSPVMPTHGPEECRPSNPALSRVLRYSSEERPEIQMYAFLPKRSGADGRPPEWRFAAFVPAVPPDAPQDFAASVRAVFERDFISRVSIPGRAYRAPPAVPPDERLPADGRERRRAIHAMFAGYSGEWTVTDAEDITVADNIPDALSRGFVTELTNSLPRLRRAYSDVLRGRIPAPPRGAEDSGASLPEINIPGSFALVRVFLDRKEYLEYLGDSIGGSQEHSAAVWIPAFRELVLNEHDAAPKGGLMREARHEAFHQFLHHAAAGAKSPPWLNEGLAELFADSGFDAEGKIEFREDPGRVELVRAFAGEMAQTLPAILLCDYDEFYEDPAEARTLRYAVAWSVCRFLAAEDGACRLRGRPFSGVIPECFASIRERRDPASATIDAFGGADGMADFISAWQAYWLGK